MLTTKLQRKARAVGLEPDGDAPTSTPCRSPTALAALGRRAGAAEPQADDPLADDDAASCARVGRPAVRGGDLAQRLGVDPEQALRERALQLRAEILAAEGVPDDAGGSR